MVSWTRVKIASAPHWGLSVARHLGCPPPPHSSEKRSLVPSLLNVAECQYEKFESDTASIRLGLATSRMSSSSPYPPHAPPANPIAGNTVMSWHWLGPGRTPLAAGAGGATMASTIFWTAPRVAALSAAVGTPPPPRALTTLSSIGMVHSAGRTYSEEHTSELQSRLHLVCRPLLDNKKRMTA